AQVRSGAARLQAVLATASALSPSATRAGTADFGVAQLPFEAGAHWVGLPAPAGAAIPGGRLSLLGHRPRPGAPRPAAPTGQRLDPPHPRDRTLNGLRHLLEPARDPLPRHDARRVRAVPDSRPVVAARPPVAGRRVHRRRRRLPGAGARPARRAHARLVLAR